MEEALKRLMLLFVTLGLFGLAVSSCVVAGGGDAAVTILETAEHSANPVLPIHNDYGPDPVLQSGQANSCLIKSDGHDLCRVLLGYKSTSTQDVHFKIFGTPDSVRESGFDWVKYGAVVTYHIAGQPFVFEGCVDGGVSSSGQMIWWCEYEQVKSVVRNLNTGGYDYLGLMWNYTKYTGDAISCAGGIGAMLAGQLYTFPMATACAAGPMQPNLMAPTTTELSPPSLQ